MHGSNGSAASTTALRMPPHLRPRPLQMELARLQAEKARRREAQLRLTIQAARRTGSLTPAAVTAFAALHIVDDAGLPIVPAAHHRLWLRLMCDTRIRKLLIIAPPESAKTTWAVTAYGSCSVGFFPERNVIVASASGSTAKTRSLSVRLMTQSPAFKETFPDVTRAKGLTWETMEWSLAPDGQPRPGRLHPTLSAYGTGGAITGSRADLAIGDDLLDFENSRTAHQRDLVEQWLHNSLLSRLKAHTGRAIIIGTAWHHDDVYAKARREGDWVVCHTPLLSEGPEIYAYLSYPDDWPFERIGQPVTQAAFEALFQEEDD